MCYTNRIHTYTNVCSMCSDVHLVNILDSIVNIYRYVWVYSYIPIYIYIYRLKRISSIRRNDDTIIQTLPDSVILKWSIPRVYDEYTFIDNTSINKYHSIYLFNSVDGKGL